MQSQKVANTYILNVLVTFKSSLTQSFGDIEVSRLDAKQIWKTKKKTQLWGIIGYMYCVTIQRIRPNNIRTGHMDWTTVTIPKKLMRKEDLGVWETLGWNCEDKGSFPFVLYSKDMRNGDWKVLQMSIE